jgi:hypothetical protein
MVISLRNGDSLPKPYGILTFIQPTMSLSVCSYHLFTRILSLSIQRDVQCPNSEVFCGQTESIYLMHNDI